MKKIEEKETEGERGTFGTEEKYKQRFGGEK